jgi:hypothetical protein
VPGDTRAGTGSGTSPEGGTSTDAETRTDGGTTASPESEAESETGAGSGIDLGRLGRTLALVGFVTAVFVLLTASRLSGALVQVGVVAIGTVAFITAIVGFLIAAGSRFDE